MRVALCGNPNVGKTTLFNRLTASDAPVGNWHGVTVDVKTKRSVFDKNVVISDLPGAYSLTPLSKEERITRDQILYGDYDAVLFIAEVNNLRRNLYLFTQLAEAKKRTAVIVNMMDEARGKVDLSLLSERLGVPVVGASEKSKTVAADIQRILPLARVPLPPDYIERGELVRAAKTLPKSELPVSYAALKVIERDVDVMEKLGCGDCAACGACADRDMPARARYAYIDRVLDGAVEKVAAYPKTRKADGIITGRAALPVFLAVMAAVFFITVEAGKPLSALIMRFIGFAADKVSATDMTPWVRSLIADGVISGAGSVLSFLPQITILFLLTALLQDSGYMSRVAFVSDGFFKRFGLNGRAAFSAVLGLSCSVTAVLSSRGIAEDGARRRCAFAAPFCPCGARLAVFTAVASYFALSGFAVAMLYVIGAAAALAVLKVMQVLGKTDEDKLIMEMPPYRLPSARRVFKSVISSVLSFLGRVGSVVAGVSVITWILCNFSVGYGFTGGEQTSIMYMLANAIASAFKPLGFGDWRAVAALISGVAAKETVVSVIGALGGMAIFTDKTCAYSFLIFTCLYVPCVATLAAIGKELGAKYALASALAHTALAYLASLVYYRSAIMFATDKRLFYTVWTCVALFLAASAVTLKIVARAKKVKREREKLPEM